MKHSHQHQAKMLRKAARRASFHEQGNDPKRVKAILARSRYLPHQSAREIKRRLERNW